MPLNQFTEDISLPDLSIRGFRGIKDLSISRLGRVTLFTGANSVGKTTLLDAIRVYASRGNYRVLNDILRSREELSLYVDEDNGNEVLGPDWDALFYGRYVTSDSRISLGPKNKSRQLRIGISPEGTTQSDVFVPGDFSIDDSQALKIEFQNNLQEIPLRHLMGRSPLRQRRLRDVESNLPHTVRCESLGPGLLNNIALAQFWDNVALTDDDDKAVKALNLIFKDKVERVVLIGDRRVSRYDRRAVVKMENEERPFPLKSLGDGAVRLFGVALALANSQGGFLVIDEAENGIHHSIQRDFWEMILRTAEENNVQVFATTHSWDCVAGFAQASTGLDEVDGALVRIERHGNDTRAVEYSEEKLEVAAKQGIEVR